MTAECVITEVESGDGVFEPSTGKVVYAAPLAVYAGICRLQREGQSAQHNREAGGAQQTARNWVLSLPLSATEPRINARVEITAATDGQAVGLVLRIAEQRGGSLVWQRDYACERWEPTVR